jgi:hypothetical protein
LLLLLGLLLPPKQPSLSFQLLVLLLELLLLLLELAPLLLDLLLQG